MLSNRIVTIMNEDIPNEKKIQANLLRTHEGAIILIDDTNG